MVNILENQALKNEFLTICREKITRSGLDSLLAWMENESDFFTAPASTRFHGNYEGGLLEHSLNVYHALTRLVKEFATQCNISEETIAIAALFHDLCKANYYAVSSRNVKDEETGIWHKVPYYTTDDKYPLGHGEKSVIILMQHMKLTDDEIYAIRWHMSGFDCAVKGGDYGCNKAYELCPFAVMLHLADMIASHLMEENSVD